ncbi:hypothetical protein GFS60_06321 (plasmid) [Rhodococcus sp. WAY2]|nr:hypothetical protein GFS60_06321 [Rhodococcus sp. WAY2]
MLTKIGMVEEGLMRAQMGFGGPRWISLLFAAVRPAGRGSCA